MTKVSIRSMFESQKTELEQKLKGLALPKDSIKVQETIEDLMNHLLDIDGEFRQGLTQSEDFILQSALRVLTIQQDLTKGILPTGRSTKTVGEASGSYPTSVFPTLIGTGVGAISGGLIGKGLAAVGSFAGIWGAVIGALAGNAIAAYFIVKKTPQVISNGEDANDTNTPIDVNVFLGIFANLCDSIDGIVETYRVQVNRVVNDYEKRERPNLQTDYSSLLDQIINLHRVSSAMTDQIPAQVKQAIVLLEESLENYGLKIENNKIVNE